MNFTPVFLAMQSLGRVAERADGDKRFATADRAAVSEAIMQGRPWDGAAPMALSIGLLLIGLGLIYALWAYRNRDKVAPPPLLTFHRLARGMGLSVTEQFALWWVGRRGKLPSPITLMLCPATFDHHTRLDARVEGWLSQRLHGARRLLFGPDREDTGG